MLNEYYSPSIYFAEKEHSRKEISFTGEHGADYGNVQKQYNPAWA
jgi:hypothetical protein